MSIDLKALTRHLVLIVGGPKRAAHICSYPGNRVSENDISLWCNDGSNRFIPVDHLLLLDAAAGHLFLKEYAASASSGETKARAASVINTVAKFAKAAGNLECITLQAEEDGKTCLREKREIQDTIAPVKDAIAQLERAIA